ncbi:hypothetical protein BD289DRAFT_442662 [Coniella lustricola]|uniref:Uncharacterized protein n=1 Tax=Coniella lustricola TaxID=2025994 RepID=A0A2T2ZY36_9PEZI|nr:hypothetical protein BD289DRAFT_442662 [Coniella lustricola]
MPVMGTVLQMLFLLAFLPALLYRRRSQRVFSYAEERPKSETQSCHDDSQQKDQSSGEQAKPHGYSPSSSLDMYSTDTIQSRQPWEQQLNVIPDQRGPVLMVAKPTRVEMRVNNRKPERKEIHPITRELTASPKTVGLGTGRVCFFLLHLLFFSSSSSLSSSIRLRRSLDPIKLKQAGSWERAVS